MMYIIWVVTWLPIKSKIIKQRSNIFRIDSVVSTTLSPEPQERSSKVLLLTIGSLFETVLLVNVYWWKLEGFLAALFLCHIGTTSALKVFLLNLSGELLMIGIVLARYSASPTIYGTVDPCKPFRSCSLKCICSPVSNCSSPKAKIPPRRNV